MPPSWKVYGPVVAVVLILCFAMALGGAMLFYRLIPSPTPTPQMIRSDTPVTTETLELLQDTTVPENDVRQLAGRLQGKWGVPLTLDPPSGVLHLGDRQTFWVLNSDSNRHFQVETTLRYITDHVYFWIADGVNYDEGDLRDLVETFENQIYPTNRRFFGSEWTPGVDGDPHLYIIYGRDLGRRVAGYFSSTDESLPQARQYSNAHELFILSADNLKLNEGFTYSVLAHEFQHMILFYNDRNESAWLSEGFSELAAFLNGYPVGGFDRIYVGRPDTQLNDWPAEDDQTPPHYGASFLFTLYFFDRFGEAATQALASNPLNGFSSVDDILLTLGAVDPLTGQTIQADDVFQDWTIATFLQDGSVGDGRYIYHNYPAVPQAEKNERFSSCPFGPKSYDVSQYGVDYIRLTCPGNYTLHFEGSSAVKLYPADPHSGSYAFWSNEGDESDMTLTRLFDLTGSQGPLTLTYWAWYNLEEDYDYLYLEASLDGENWQILTTPSCTSRNPSGSSYGCGYNGNSGGGEAARWILERVDLSPFAGRQVYLRFEYITDPQVNGEGFVLDDVAIAELGYFADFEKDMGGWEASGFVRAQNILPQTFRLALIIQGAATTVEYIPLRADLTADIPLYIGDDVKNVTLVVSGTTRFTRQKAVYSVEVRP